MLRSLKKLWRLVWLEYKVLDYYTPLPLPVMPKGLEEVTLMAGEHLPVNILCHV